MNLTNGQIYSITEELYKMRQVALPIKLSFLIAKNLITLEPFYKAIIDTRTKILEEYGYDGSPNFHFSEEMVQKVNQALIEIQDIENEIFLGKLPLSLMLETNTNITPNEMEILYPIISEED